MRFMKYYGYSMASKHGFSVGDYKSFERQRGCIIMRISRVIEKEMQKSGGRVRVVKVPANKRPTASALAKLEREIASQVSANEAMSNRSMLYAARSGVLK